MTILVTGGAGYIGSHMTYALLDKGEEVVVLDNLSAGQRKAVSKDARFIEGNAGDKTLLGHLISQNAINAVIHFAGSVVVPESVERPLLYYANNTEVSRNLIEICVERGVNNFIFSSTAAVYGSPDREYVDETAPTLPINPYGRSKLMTEWILQDAAIAHPFRYMALRYFNVAGADPKGRTGQSTQTPTHLIQRACQTALGALPHLDILGTDYPTPDGTGVRDYIHVSDLVNAHICALDGLRAGAPIGAYNCGYGRGFSVRDVITAMEKVTGKKLNTREVPRRVGDPACIVSNPQRLKTTLGWQPEHANLEEIVQSAFAWESLRKA